MKIKAKGGKLPAVVKFAGVDNATYRALKDGKEIEVDTIHTKLIPYVEKVKVQKVKTSEVK